MNVPRTVFFTLLLIFLSLPYLFLTADQDFVIDADAPPAVIRVQSGADFTLTIRERGWYLNRYDRTRLLFKSRIIDTVRTVFVMNALASGEARIVLSYRETDLDLVIRILEGTKWIETLDDGSEIARNLETEGDSTLADSRPGVQEDRKESAEAKPGGGERKTSTVTERMKVLRERVAGPEQAEGSVEQESQGQETVSDEPPAKERGEGERQAIQKRDETLYYIDEGNRVVSVPRVAEEDEYRRGRRFYRNEQFGEAESSLQRYLSTCEKCVSRDSARLMLADIACRGGREDEGLVLLDAVIEEGGGSLHSQALTKRAELYYRSGRRAQAAQDYERLYESTGIQGSDIPRKLGDIYFSLDQKQQALQWYEQSVLQEAADDEIIFRIATIYDSPGSNRDIQKAYRFYRIITEEYESSVHFEKARERMRFFEKNFFDYQ
jgi:tetratricopeptide (TPR) repeat protein